MRQQNPVFMLIYTIYLYVGYNHELASGEIIRPPNSNLPQPPFCNLQRRWYRELNPSPIIYAPLGAEKFWQWDHGFAGYRVALEGLSACLQGVGGRLVRPEQVCIYQDLVQRERPA